MNNLKVSMNMLKGLSLCSTLCLAVAAGQSQAQQMTSGNSTATLDAHGGGLNSWFVDGQNQLAQQWFWYRLDGSSAADQKINTLSSANVTQPSAGQLNVVYQSSKLRVEVDYSLSGDNFGDGSASLTEVIKIRNVSGAALSGHFIQYSDFDLAGSSAGDSVQMNRDQSSLLFSGAMQTKGSLSLTSGDATQVQSDTIPFAAGGEAGVGSSILGNLATAYDLSGNLTSGPGDANWALEWNFNLNANQSCSIVRSESITGVMVPEPSSLAMLAAGLAWVVTAAGRRSRHNG